jgi:hypothetical protein
VRRGGLEFLWFLLLRAPFWLMGIMGVMKIERRKNGLVSRVLEDGIEVIDGGVKLGDDGKPRLSEKRGMSRLVLTK